MNQRREFPQLQLGDERSPRKLFKDGIAVFDADGTLIQGHPIHEFASLLNSRRLFDPAQFQKLGELVRLREARKIGHEEYAAKAVAAYAQGIAGQRTEQVARMAEEFGRKLALNRHIEKIVPLLETKRKVLISAAPLEMVRKLRNVFPADDILATVVEEANGVYTGNVSLNLGTKGAKDKEFEKFVSSANISLKDSIGFGNTEQDVRFLDRMELSVAVIPPALLKELQDSGKELAPWLRTAVKHLRKHSFILSLST